MTDDIRTLSAQLAADPSSLAFLRLGEMLRARGQLEPAIKVVLQGLSRYPHLPDAHDLYARVLTDRRDYATAFDEWDMTLRLAPEHVGAHKGIGFLYYRAGELDQALHHLRRALELDPGDAGLQQAVERVAGGTAYWEPASAPPAVPEAAAEPEPVPETAAAADGPFSDLEGGAEQVLLVDRDGFRLGGGLLAPDGRDVSEEVAAALASTVQEAGRAARLLDLGQWNHFTIEADTRHVCLLTPAPDAGLLAAVDPEQSPGQLSFFADRAARAARAWLEQAR